MEGDIVGWKFQATGASQGVFFPFLLTGRSKRGRDVELFKISL